MSQDLTVRRSRRAILGAALGGAAAVAVSTVAKPLSVEAATGDDTILGQANTADVVTSIENTVGGTGLQGVSSTGTGVVGESTDSQPTDDYTVPSNKTGVFGTAGDTTAAATNTDETGVYGWADLSTTSTGVWGDSSSGTGVFGTGSTGVSGSGDWGVYGEGDSVGALAYTDSNIAVYGTAYNFPEPPWGQMIGVLGAGPSNGTGVYGFTGDGAPVAPPDGVGVYAHALSTSQVALQVTGKVKFNRSGRVAVGSTSTSKRVTMGGVTSSSYVIATMQTNVSGVYVRSVVCSSGYFYIYLSKAPGKTVYVGYLVVN